MSGELREQLAAIEHERWADWQRYMHRLCGHDGNAVGYEVVIPAHLVDRWERQIATPYAELSEAEKASDREQVDRYWPLIAAVIAEVEQLRARVGADASYIKELIAERDRLSASVESGEPSTDEGLRQSSPHRYAERAVIDAAKAWRVAASSFLEELAPEEIALIDAVDGLGETDKAAGEEAPGRCASVHQGERCTRYEGHEAEHRNTIFTDALRWPNATAARYPNSWCAKFADHDAHAWGNPPNWCEGGEMQSCKVTVWDGPYSMTCGRAMPRGECLTHGRPRTAAPAGLGGTAQTEQEAT